MIPRNARERREYATYKRARQYHTEVLAEIARKLLQFEATNDEAAYNALDEAEWTPAFIAMRREIGSEIMPSVVKDAYTLARLPRA